MRVIWTVSAGPIIDIWSVWGEGAPPYLDWISELAEKALLGAVKIKIADNEDNNDPARIAQPPPAERDVSEYYTKARTILAAALARRAMG